MNVDPEKVKGPLAEGYYQPSLFEDDVVDARCTSQVSIPSLTSKQGRKHRSRRVSGKIVDLRDYKGAQIASHSQIQRHEDYYLVPSVSGQHSYKVDAKAYTCECADFQWQRKKCKHIIAIEIAFGNQIQSHTWQSRDKKYARDWQVYNKSQTSEKSVFLKLLSELTRAIYEPESIRTDGLRSIVVIWFLHVCSKCIPKCPAVGFQLI